jgi:hypothetical protein
MAGQNSALTRQPQNTNLLQTTKFILTLPRITNTQYFCQDTILPGVSLSVITRATPVVDIWSPGSKLAYNEFEVTFLVDEDLRAWTDIHDWMRGLAGGVDDREWERSNRKLAADPENPLKQYSDGILTIYSALNNPKIRIKYANMFPTDLSDIKFDSTQGADTILTATAKFRFDFFNIDRL